MSDGRAWRNSHQSFHDDATSLVRKCVTYLRGRGMKTDTALQTLPDLLTSPAQPVSQRRVRTLFHRDLDPVVMAGEWRALRYRAGIFFLNEAARLRVLADEIEADGEALVSDRDTGGQLEFSWGQSECGKGLFA